MREARLFLAALMALAALSGTASANHSITELVSKGPTAGYPSGAGSAIPSADGSHVFFNSDDRLVAADADQYGDVYERSGGVTTLVSTGPSGGAGKTSAYVLAASADGTRVIFETAERLTGDDQDDSVDIYQRFSGTTTLLSDGPAGGNGPNNVTFGGASADATHVVFSTAEPLVSGDTDSSGDIYESFGGTTTLASTGPLDNGNNVAAQFPTASGTFISGDGQHVFFRTNTTLTPDDVPGDDIFDRTGGTTKLVTTGPTDTGAGSLSSYDFDISYDGTAVFSTTSKLVAGDLDNNLSDVYMRSGNTTTLVSTGPGDTHMFPICTGGTVTNDDCQPRISQDGSHVFFFTHESLTSQDTGGYLDIYDYSGGTVKLVSIGPTGGNGPIHVDHMRPVTSSDGTHVLFATLEALTSDDTDACTGSQPTGCLDIFDRFNNTTTLVSTGPTDPGNYSAGKPYISADGSRVFWESGNALVAEDTNTDEDIYERYAGGTTLITPGTSNSGSPYYPPDPAIDAISPDGTRVYFTTNDALLAEDTDICTSVYFCGDLYERRVATVGPQAPSGAAEALPSYDRLTPGDAIP
jgi:hypothetical protein